MSKSAWFAVLLLLFALPVTAEVQRTTGTKGGKPYLEMTNDRVMQGTVVAINQKKREVKLLNEVGDTLEVVVASQVKNLSKVHVDDVVKIRIKEQTTIEIATGPALPDTEEVVVKTAEPGEHPHGSVTKTARATATIVAIDKGMNNVTLQGQDGNTYTVKAKRKETLDQVKVGDMVVFTSVKSVATSLVKAPVKQGS
jgi:hypothetical protein